MSATFVLASARFAAAMARLCLGPLLPILTVELGFEAEDKPALLAAYSSGYIVTQVLGGALADRYGARSIVILAVGGNALGMLILSTGWWSSIELWTRLYFTLGALAGPLFPASSVVFSSSVSPDKRAGAAAIVDAAASAGTCVANLAPAMAVAMGWRSVFSCIAVLLFGTTVGAQVNFQAKKTSDLASSGQTNQPSTPFSVLLSIPAVSIFLCHFCDNFTKYILNAWLATMFVEKFNFPVTMVGGYLFVQDAMGVTSRVVIGLRDSGASPQWRTTASGAAFALQGAFLYLAFQSTSPTLCAAYLTMSSMCNGGHAVGFRPRYFEIAPEHAGVLSGVGNTLASTASALGPLLVGMIMTGEHHDVDASFTTREAFEKWSRVGQMLLAVNFMGSFVTLGMVSKSSGVKTLSE